ncbi:hypothetical protein [Geodermatophilus chilensis]|uniref:hypothetical protein n=1 Tax=Geodermatophilus chilensis TaxID=2035835 RepID=UPI000C269AF5|nr:hypothetical protein [Geodermatophilus chilensis]
MSATGRHRPRQSAEPTPDDHRRPVLLHYAATGWPAQHRWSERLALTAGALAVLVAIGTATLVGAWAGFSLLGPSVEPARPAAAAKVPGDGTAVGGTCRDQPAAASPMEGPAGRPGDAGSERPTEAVLEQRSEASAVDSAPAGPFPASRGPAGSPTPEQREDVGAGAPGQNGSTTTPSTQGPAAAVPAERSR